MPKFSDPNVKTIFDTYNKYQRKQLLELRRIIFAAHKELKTKEYLIETLKWNQPAYLMKGSSTIRLGISKSSTDTVSLFFNCKSKIIETVKEVFNDNCECIGNREIVFSINDELPEDDIKTIIQLGLQYHSLKKLPMLGLTL